MGMMESAYEVVFRSSAALDGLDVSVRDRMVGRGGSGATVRVKLSAPTVTGRILLWCLQRVGFTIEVWDGDEALQPWRPVTLDGHYLRRLQ